MACRIFLVAASMLAGMLLQPVCALAAETPLANGVLLVAKPDLFDPNFSETVVLITQLQAGSGQIGVIINRPLGARLSEGVPDLGVVPEPFDKLYVGGPVARDQILYLLRATTRPERSVQVLEDVFLSGDAPLLKRIVSGEVKVAAFRAFAGMSGWALRQLRAEIEQGGWYVIPADAETIFAANVATMWQDLIRRITSRSTNLVPLHGGKTALR